MSLDGSNLSESFCGRDSELILDGGEFLEEIDVAYTTKGFLSPNRDNAILICHALTGDQFMADTHPITGRSGWWDNVVGSGKSIDTDKFFVICSNVLGGCLGTTGPMSINPLTGKPYGLKFPEISIGDMVKVQRVLIRRLGIEKLFAVVGGSMGSMQVLEWMTRYPKDVDYCVTIAGATRHTPQNIAFHEGGRAAIISDPNFNEGDYYDKGAESKPERGLSVARMMAHITYLSEEALQRKFGRNFQDISNFANQVFRRDFEVESYLRYQGKSFVKRFDANSYLYLTRAMDYFDLSSRYDGDLTRAFEEVMSGNLVVSFTSDWLFPPRESKVIVRALIANGKRVSEAIVDTDSGHDSFLLEVPKFHEVLKSFIEGARASRDQE